MTTTYADIRRTIKDILGLTAAEDRFLAANKALDERYGKAVKALRARQLPQVEEFMREKRLRDRRHEHFNRAIAAFEDAIETARAQLHANA